MFENVIDTLHGGRVGHLAEAFAEVVAHALGGGIGRDELGVLALQLLDFAVELIVLGIRDFGLGLCVIQLVVVAHNVAELRVAFLRSLLCLLLGGGEFEEVHGDCAASYHTRARVVNSVLCLR